MSINATTHVDLIGQCASETAAGGDVSCVRATLVPSSVVTTLKTTVGHIVTERGIADMRGRSISQRARSLIAIMSATPSVRAPCSMYALTPRRSSEPCP